MDIIKGVRIMANEQNLIPINQRTENEQREMRVRAGKKSGESRRRKKTIKEWLGEFSELPAPEEFLKKMRKIGYKGKDETFGALMAYQYMMYSIKGKPQYARMVLEMLGETQPQGQVVNNLPPSINVKFVGDDDGC